MASLDLVSPDPTSSAGRAARRVRRSILAWLGVASFALAMLGVFATPFVVEHTSMAATLQPGELVLVDRVTPRLGGIERGEVVIFRPPISGYAGEPFVKRVIALPGENVSIRQGRVYVNGRPLREPYLYDCEPTTTDRADFEVTVPAGSIFVLGDHRADSWDSRGYGPVPVANIVGRAWLAFDHATSIAILGSPTYPATGGQPS